MESHSVVQTGHSAKSTAPGVRESGILYIRPDPPACLPPPTSLKTGQEGARPSATRKAGRIGPGAPVTTQNFRKSYCLGICGKWHRNTQPTPKKPETKFRNHISPHIWVTQCSEDLSRFTTAAFTEPPTRRSTYFRKNKTDLDFGFDLDIASHRYDLAHSEIYCFSVIPSWEHARERQLFGNQRTWGKTYRHRWL